MFLYNLTVKDPSFVSNCISGSFSGEKRHEFLIVRGTSIIEIMWPNPETGKLESLIVQETFCKIRSIIPYRLVGSSKDFFIIGSDSGRILVMEYVRTATRNSLEKVHQETFGKSGTRRIVPGQYLTGDPKGRAVMISALEKGKLIYILNNDATGKLTISSPLEANKSKCITCCTIGVDVGYSNPLFAALELDYSVCEGESAAERPAKLIAYYELDLGLNHVVRKASYPVDLSANTLISLPAGSTGSNGLLICQNNCIKWMPSIQEQDLISITIPRASIPSLNATRDILIVSHVVHKSQNSFFVLVLNEDGDIFKITIDAGSKLITIVYFDTLIGAHSLSLTKNGFLYVSFFSGSNALYQVQKLGDDEECIFTSGNSTTQTNWTFKRHEELENLGLVEQFNGIFPMTDFRLISSNNQMQSSIYACIGTTPNNSLTVLQYGIPTSQVADSTIPAESHGIWCLKSELTDTFHSILLLSFPRKTLVLQIQESISEFAGPHNFITNSSTLQVYTLFNNTYVQITSDTVRHIKSISSFVDWKIPYLTKPITCCTCNGRQLIVILGEVELLYFEIDELGDLREMAERKVVPSPIQCLSIGDLPASLTYSPFLAVGCNDQTCRLISLRKDDSWLEMLSIQVFSSSPHSLQLVHPMEQEPSTLFLHVSLESGDYCNISVNSVDGSFQEIRTKNIANSPFSLASVSLEDGKKGVFVQGFRPHLVCSQQNSSLLTAVPLLIDFPVDFVANFSSEQCPNGFVAISQEQLKIFSIDTTVASYGSTRNVSLMFTPKKMVFSAIGDALAIIESDHATECLIDSKSNSINGKAETIEKDSQNRNQSCDEDAMQMSSDESEMEISSGEDEPEAVETTTSMEIIGRCAAGKWSSRVSIFDPFSMQLLQDIRLGNGYVPVSAAFVEFSSSLQFNYFVVGAVQNFIPNPKSFSKCALFTFQQSDPSSHTYSILHVTEVEQIPLAICPFQGMLLVGMGNILRMYDLGKLKLLRKCENKQCKGQIAGIYSKGLRIVATDSQMGPLFFHYKIHDNQFVLVSDDPLPRHPTSATAIDWDTVGVADKFGNIFINRIPDSLAQIITADPSCSRITERPYLQGAPYKCNTIADFHIGELISHLEKGILMIGGRECIVYSGILGRIGLLVPFQRRSEFDLVQLLESAMRQECGDLFGRDHFAYRSSYSPVQNVVDGDLCEMFYRLSQERKSVVAGSLGKSVQEISTLLLDLRESVAF